MFGGVVDFQSAGQSSCFLRLEGFIKGRRTVGVEIIHHQADLGGLRVSLIEHAFNEERPVLAGTVVGDGDVALSGQRFNLQEDFGHPVTNILVIDYLSASWSYRQGGVNFAHQLLVGFVHADNWELRVVRRVVNIQHIFHAYHKSGTPVGRDFPVFAQVRFKFVFFKARWIVMVETFGAIFNSTTFSASRRTVQRARPSGAGEHARAVSRASKAPSKVSLGALVVGFALQCGFDPFFHETLFEVFNRAWGDA